MSTLRSLSIGIIKRLAFGALVLIALIYLTHFGLDMARGVEFQDALVRGVEKTVLYLGRLLRGDFGMTEAGSINLLPSEVAEIVPERVVRSLGLLAVSLGIASLFGIWLGIWGAWRRKSEMPFFPLLLSIVGISAPSFFAALTLQLLAIQLTKRAGFTVLPVGGFGWDLHLLLPALVLAARPLAQIARVSFVTLSETLDQDYVRTAYGKGLEDRLVLNRHVLRNVAVPVLTTIGLSLSFALSSLPVVEYFFAWPGLGYTLLRSISLQDDNLTVALVLCMGALFILVNILLNILYRFIDPRMAETPDHVNRSDRRTLPNFFRSIWRAIRDTFTDHPLRRWLDARGREPEESPFAAFLDEQNGQEGDYRSGRPGELRAWLKGTVGNLLFVSGGILVAGLIVILLFGPRLAPHSPYTTQGLTVVEGTIQVPPFAPGEDHPFGTDVLGRDILSLILAGAQQTLVLAGLVVLARLVVGFVLGALAGWFSGTVFDRLLLSIAEIINAFPTLLLAMILILGLGIREGMRPFVIALCFVGWVELMTFVRGQVMALRSRLFIESAIALGQTNFRIIFKHVLPNLIPGLISLTSLEMGAVLMLLGELGFIGIFIGGGAFAELDVAAAPYHYSDVPEWGALLSNVRTYARAYPWTSVYPALAFFLAILGFNLFGEGVRRMVETVGVGISRVVNRYTLALSVFAVAGFVTFRGSTGSLTYYLRQAEAFNADNALLQSLVLSDPAFEGRALGTRGMEITAEYIAGQFSELGIQPAGENLTFFQERKREYFQLTEAPRLSIADNGSEPVYREDFIEYPADHLIVGECEGPVRFVTLNSLNTSGAWRAEYMALKGMDFSEDVLMVLDAGDLFYLRDMPRLGVLVVADTPERLKQNYTLHYRLPEYRISWVGRERGTDAPFLWISEELADRILAPSGRTVKELRFQSESLLVNQFIDFDTGSRVSMQVQGELKEQRVRHVIGHMPGVSDSRYGGMNAEMVVVLAQYDTPPPVPGEEIYTGANNNATGVAVMLEAIRNMKEQGYQPYRTFLFVAYSGEGFEGGEPASKEVSRLLQTKYGFSSTFDVVSIVEIRSLGAGEGKGLSISDSGSLRLTNLFESAAERVGVPVERSSESIDLSIVFQDRDRNQGGQEAPMIELSWQDWRSYGAAEELPAILSKEKLGDSGRALSLAWMILGREREY